MRFLPMGLVLILLPAVSWGADCPSFLQQDVKRLHSTEQINLCEASGEKATLIVNTASYCGYTKQFEDLEALHKKYSDQGFKIIGFASNSFNQEAKDEAEAASVCFKNYGVTFDMVAPTPVKGNEANSIFKHLAEVSQEPRWNFNKYLVMADGTVQHFGSSIKPLGSTLESEIQQALKTPQ